jgi:hypothetical protein
MRHPPNKLKNKYVNRTEYMYIYTYKKVYIYIYAGEWSNNTTKGLKFMTTIKIETKTLLLNNF